MEKSLYGTGQGRRIWELDLIRGLCVLAMIFDHTLFDLKYIFGLEAPCLTGYFHWWLRTGVRIGVVLCFVLICGISCSLSHSNLARGLKLAGVAGLLTLVTWLLDIAAGMSHEFLITFGVLHMLAASILFYCLVHKYFGPKSILILAILFAVTGIYFSAGVHYAPEGREWLGLIVQLNDAFYSADYFPFLPGAGFFLIGSLLGPILYKEKKSRFKRGGKAYLTKPVLFTGRHALVFYLGHQPVIMLALTVLMFLVSGRPMAL